MLYYDCMPGVSGAVFPALPRCRSFDPAQRLCAELCNFLPPESVLPQTSITMTYLHGLIWIAVGLVTPLLAQQSLKASFPRMALQPGTTALAIRHQICPPSDGHCRSGS